jgi:hypothetical protein
MPQYVLVNRRSGMFTNNAKIASRDTVSATLGLLTSARIVANHQPADPLARRVVLLDADEGQIAALRATLPADSILELAIRRNLHHRVPLELKPVIPHAVTTLSHSTSGNTTLGSSGDIILNFSELGMVSPELTTASTTHAIRPGSTPPWNQGDLPCSSPTWPRMAGGSDRF